MAAMTTVLTQFTDSNNGNTRTYTAPSHTVSAPQLVIQKRRVAVGNSGSSQSNIDIAFATLDADGALLASRTVGGVFIREPINAGDATARTAVLALLREIVASDEFTNVVETQEWIQS
jgi:hypothetical protein